MPVLYWRLARSTSLRRLTATIRSLNLSIVITYRLRLTRAAPTCVHVRFTSDSRKVQFIFRVRLLQI